MRVLLVIPGISPDGGAERSLMATAPDLLARGVQLHLAVLTDRQGLVPELERMGVVVHDLSRQRRVLRQSRALREVIRQIRPALLHASLFDASLASQLAVLGTDVPVLVTWANTSYGEARRGEAGASHWKLRLIELLETVLGRLSGSWYHAVTPAVGAVTGAALRVDPSRILVGRRGRNPDEFHPRGDAVRADLGDLGLPAEARVVLAVGRQDHQKGYDDLLVQFDRLADTHPGVHLVLAGRHGSATGRIQEVHAGMRHPSAVHFLGQRDDVPRLLAAADVVVNSSWREGAAGALIEAMASEVPVVSVRLEGLEGVLMDGVNALVVERDALADGLARVLDDHGLATRLAKAGRRIFEAEYTTSAASGRMVEIYRTVAAGG